MAAHIIWTRSHLDSRILNDTFNSDDASFRHDTSTGSVDLLPEVAEPVYSERGVPRDVVFLPEGGIANIALSSQLDEADPNTSNGCIEVFRVDGSTMSGIPNVNVAGMTLTCDGHLAFVVTEYGSDRVELRNVKNAEWNLVRSWGGGRCATASGLSQNWENGNWVLTDTKHHNICIYSESGSLLNRFGNRGDRRPQFNSPKYVTFDPIHRGRIVVSDTGNGRVKIHDSEGRTLTVFGSHEMKAPGGVAVDPQRGHIYVADMQGNGVFKYSADGIFTGQKILFHANDNRCHTNPTGIAINNEATRLAVVGCYPDNVLTVFKLTSATDIEFELNLRDKRKSLNEACVVPVTEL